MDKLSTNKTMTTKEVAEALGVGVRTVQENGKALFPNRIVNGKPTHWTQAEVGMIAEQIKNNHSTTQATAQVTREVTTAYTVPNLLTKAKENAKTIEQKMQIANAGMQALAEAMEQLRAENINLKHERNDLLCDKQQLQVALDASKSFASVKLMERLNPNRKFDWRVLKNKSKELSCKIEKCIDQNYGEVNAYSKEVWEACYELDTAPWD